MLVEIFKGYKICTNKLYINRYEISFSLMVTVKEFTLRHSALDWRISIPSFWISQYNIISWIWFWCFLANFNISFQYCISILNVSFWFPFLMLEKVIQRKHIYGNEDVNIFYSEAVKVFSLLSIFISYF